MEMNHRTKYTNYLTKLSTPSATAMSSLVRGSLSPILFTAVTRNLDIT